MTFGAFGMLVESFGAYTSEAEHTHKTVCRRPEMCCVWLHANRQFGKSKVWGVLMNFHDFYRAVSLLLNWLPRARALMNLVKKKKRRNHDSINLKSHKQNSSRELLMNEQNFPIFIPPKWFINVDNSLSTSFLLFNEISASRINWNTQKKTREKNERFRLMILLPFIRF